MYIAINHKQIVPPSRINNDNMGAAAKAGMQLTSPLTINLGRLLPSWT
jgi:hypothetical protein